MSSSLSLFSEPKWALACRVTWTKMHFGFGWREDLFTSKVAPWWPLFSVFFFFFLEGRSKLVSAKAYQAVWEGGGGVSLFHH